MNFNFHILRKHKTYFAAVAILTAAILLLLTVHPFVVVGASMEPVYAHDELVFVQSITHRFGISRGDVLVFENPHDTEHVTIKRVVGLPNEKIMITREGVRVVDGGGNETMFERGTVIGGDGGGDFEMQLGPEDYLVLGDNRSKSTDSRSFGAVQMHDIIGKPLLSLNFAFLGM